MYVLLLTATTMGANTSCTGNSYNEVKKVLLKKECVSGPNMAYGFKDPNGRRAPIWLFGETHNPTLAYPACPLLTTLLRQTLQCNTHCLPGSRQSFHLFVESIDWIKHEALMHVSHAQEAQDMNMRTALFRPRNELQFNNLQMQIHYIREVAFEVEQRCGRSRVHYEDLFQEFRIDRNDLGAPEPDVHDQYWQIVDRITRYFSNMPPLPTRIQLQRSTFYQLAMELSMRLKIAASDCQLQPRTIDYFIWLLDWWTDVVERAGEVLPDTCLMFLRDSLQAMTDLLAVEHMVNMKATDPTTGIIVGYWGKNHVYSQGKFLQLESFVCTDAYNNSDDDAALFPHLASTFRRPILFIPSELNQQAR